MKRSTKVKIIVFFIVFFLCFVDLRPLFRTKKPLSTIITTPIVDETRTSYNQGSCYDMESDICYVIVHLDDDESKWNEKEINEFTEKKFLVSLDYLSRKASEYSTTLCKEYRNYFSDKNAEIAYNGIVDADIVTNGAQEDILNQVATSMKCSSPEEMDSLLKKELNVNQIAYIIVLNKEGRSYKHSYITEDSELMEFCVFFDDSINLDGNTCCSTISHEILHLFGAEDFYDPYGDMPERQKLAQTLYPNDIMFTLMTDVNDAQIGGYTAYSVGWTDTLPEECDVPEWWS